MTDWIGADSEKLTAAYAALEASPVAVAEALFEHMAAQDEELGAVRVLSREAALESAAASERRWRRHAPQSPLDGVPVMVREDISLPSYANEVEGVSPVVARLLEAGCVVLGKTVMAAHDAVVAGRCIEGRLVRNPWQPALTTGGSSAGAAVACAAGYAPLHVAIDRIGSLRMPAAFCGVFGFKPTQGRVPLAAPAMGRVAGPITRSVHDAAAMMNILARPDDRDFACLPPESPEYRMRVDGMSPKSLTIAVLTDMGVGPAVDPAIRLAVQEAARVLQTAGASVEMIDGFLDPEMFESMQMLLEAGAHRDLEAMSEHERARLPGFVVDWAERRAPGFSGPQVMQALADIVRMRAAINESMLGYDYLLMPVSPVLPWAAGSLSPTNDPQDGLPHVAFTVPWNFAEHPAASLNWRHGVDGVPVGVQVVGHRFDDLGVLRLSRTLEIMRPEQAGWPLG